MVLPVNDALVVKAQWDVTYCRNSLVEKQYGDDWENDLSTITPLCQEFAAATASPAPGSPTAMAWIGDGCPPVDNLPAPLWRLTAGETADGHLRLQGHFGYTMTPDNWLVMTHEKRCNSFCFIQNSTQVTLEDVELLQSGSMGVIAQLSRDITLRRFCVRANRARGRIVSTNADATHFVHCTGRLQLCGCVLESMMDDAGNIHGLYTRVEAQGERELLLRLGHFQHRNMLPYCPGDRLRLLQPETLRPLGEVTIREAVLTGPFTFRVRTDEPLPPCTGALTEDPDNQPEVLIEDCYTGKNRPRGFLINTSRTAVLRHNLFYNSGCGVLAAGDPRYWYEAGPASALTVEDNTFDGCNTLDDGYAVTVGPERLPQKPTTAVSGCSATGLSTETAG